MENPGPPVSVPVIPTTDTAGWPSRRNLFGIAVSAGAAAMLPGCAFPERGPAVPLGQVTKASVLGLPNERFFPLLGADALEAEVMATLQRQQRARNLSADAPLPELQLLSVSGGGENGAFGAGLLCGWSEYGTRPVFDLVTGVSTGALTAPFAYLGSGYDPQLRTVYTEPHVIQGAHQAQHSGGCVRRRAERQLAAVQHHFPIPERRYAGGDRESL